MPGLILGCPALRLFSRFSVRPAVRSPSSPCPHAHLPAAPGAAPGHEGHRGCRAEAGGCHGLLQKERKSCAWPCFSWSLLDPAADSGAAEEAAVLFASGRWHPQRKASRPQGTHKSRSKASNSKTANQAERAELPGIASHFLKGRSADRQSTHPAQLGDAAPAVPASLGS